jgi:hypothetical protein
MKVRDLYKLIQDSYPEGKRDLNTLAWPLHQPLLGVQYIDSDGHLIPPIVPNPFTFLFAEAMVGPFYDLPVVGICPLIPPKKFGGWKRFRIVVQTDLEMTLSSQVQLHINMDTWKGLASDWGIEWYHVNFDWPWHFTRFPKLDDCVRYERETNKGSV